MAEKQQVGRAALEILYTKSPNVISRVGGLEVLTLRKQFSVHYTTIQILELPGNPLGPESHWFVWQSGAEVPLTLEGLYDGSTIQPGNLEPHSP